MEENKLSANLEKINVSVGDIRNTLDAQDVAIDDLQNPRKAVKQMLENNIKNLSFST